MDGALLTAIIAAGSACVGSLIPCLFSYLGKWRDYKISKASKVAEIRRDVYANYIEALQTMVNKQDMESLLLLQKSTNKILLFADYNLSSLVNNYYKDLINSSLQKKPLSLEEHTESQTKILNAMRKELEVSQDELKDFSFVRIIT